MFTLIGSKLTSFLRVAFFGLIIFIEVIGQYGQYFESPCPQIFQYHYDGNNELYGVIQVNVANSNRMQLDVELSVGNNVQGYNGRIELAYSKQRVINDILSRRPVIYKVFFPRWYQIPPKITSILLNGNLLCYGPKLTFGVASVITTVNLQHVLRVDVQGLTYPFVGENNLNFIPSQDERPTTPLDDFDVRGSPPDDRRRPTPDDGQRPNRFNFNPGAQPEILNGKNKFNFRPEMPDDPSKVYAGNPFFRSSTTGRPVVIDQAPSLLPSSSSDSDSEDFSPNIEFTSKNSDSALDSVCGRPVTTNQLIFNGNMVPRGAYPWLCALFGVKDIGLNYMCSATLISNKHVVTAAHCVEGDGKKLRPQSLLIILGKHNIQKWVPMEGEKMIEPESIHVHPDYQSSSGDADIAVLVLSETLQFTKFIRPLCLWSGNTDLQKIVGEVGTVAGWGKDESGALMTAEPRQTNLPIVSQEDCLRSSYQFKDITSNRTFCAGFRNGSGPCNGDSGSGFVININGRWELRGVVSMSISATHARTCDLKHYVVFTDASKFLTWLLSFVK